MNTKTHSNPNHDGKIISNCQDLLSNEVEMKMRIYEKSFKERDDHLIAKMDELINIVRKEYTTNRMLIYLLFAIDVVIISVIAFLHSIPK